MLHPDIKIQWISDSIGYGLFASKLIPKGSITFVQDELDIIVKKEEFAKKSDAIKPYIDRFSYLDAKGDCVISWDFGKFMNHCCHANSLTTGYGFEIAVRDILPGEEVTDDYDVFVDCHQMTIQCAKENCRKKLDKDNFEKLVPEWDKKIKEAFLEFEKVSQPLLKFLDKKTDQDVKSYLKDPKTYLSISNQRPHSKK